MDNPVRSKEIVRNYPPYTGSNRCQVAININAQVKRVDADGTSYEYAKDLGAGAHVATGSFTDDGFVGSWNANYDGGALTYYGSVWVIIDSSGTKPFVGRVKWEEVWKRYVGNELKSTGSYSFVAYGVPVKSYEPHLYQSSGIVACELLIEVNYFERDYEYSTLDTLVSYSCGETEYVRVVLWQE